MKIAIVGSRDWHYAQPIANVIRALPAGTIVISGGARGVDTMAEDFARQRDDLKVLIFPANWDLYGNGAGYVRNREMVEACDRLVAFWDGKSSGTLHSIRLARKHDKPLTIYYPDGRIEQENQT